MLGQRRRRWADFVQILYKCFVFAGLAQWFELPTRETMGSNPTSSLVVIFVTDLNSILYDTRTTF